MTTMEAMTQEIMAHGGVVKQYVGDQVMALFGAPAPRHSEAEIAGDAVQAVRCALAMSERLQQINTEWMAQRQPTVAVRIGIHTGPVVAGSLIGKRRQSSACARSAIKSATSSIPTDSRTSPSSIPSSRRTAGGTEA